MMAVIKDVVATIRELAIILVIVLFVLFPVQMRSILVRVGLKELDTPLGHISLVEQVDQTKTALNAAISAQGTALQPNTQEKLTTVVQQLQSTLTQQVRTLNAADPAALPRQGWVYLGTVGADRRAWKPGLAATITDAWPIVTGQTVVLATDANLRGDSASNDRPRAPIVSVLTAGSRATVEEMDSARAVAADDRDAPGFRVWARVQAQLPAR